RLCPGSLRRTIDELSDALGELRGQGLAAPVTLDLGEVRGFGYYTGVRFAVFAPGSGDALAQGGRYDDLVSRYGRAARATGFAIDVEAVAGALELGSEPRGPRRGGSLVSGSRLVAPRVAAALRRRGERASCHPDATASERALRQHAAHWGYDRVIVVTPRGATVLDAAGERIRMSAAEFSELK